MNIENIEKFNKWAIDGRKLGAMEALFAWEAWKAATLIEREECAKLCDAMASDDLLPPNDRACAVDCAIDIRLRSND